jgi:hypothetical protein
LILSLSAKIEKYDGRRIADRCVMSGEIGAAGRGVHPKHGDVITALITAIEELAGRVEVETARIVAAGPLSSDIF